MSSKTWSLQRSQYRLLEHTYLTCILDVSLSALMWQFKSAGEYL